MGLDVISKLLIGNIPSSLSEVIDYNIDRAMKGETPQFIYGLDVYLKADDASKEYYVSKGKDAILSIVEANPKAKIDMQMFSALPDTYFAFNGALEDGVLVGFDMEKEGCPRSLYTRNFSLIKELNKKGCIVNADKLEKAEGSVKGVKTLNGIKNLEEVAIGVARLDFEGIVNGNQMYKVVVPQQPLRVGLNNPVLMTPLKSLYILSSKLDILFANRLVRFTESTPFGIKQGVVTSNVAKVKEVYSPTDVSKKINIMECGYNYNLLRYFTYDLESSVYSKGYSTFRPEMLDRLELVDIKDIDTSRHLIDSRLLKIIYDEKVKGLGLDDMLTVKFYDLSSFVTVSDKCDALLSFGDELKSSELYTIMKQNPGIFGDMEYELNMAELKLPKVLKDLAIVPIPKTVEEFKTLVNNGLVKVTTVTKKGKVMDVTVTNNKKVLTQLLGGDYIRKYESTKYKYLEFKKVVENSTFSDRKQLEELALHYGIDMGVVVNNVSDTFDGNTDAVLKSVDKCLDELSEKSSKKALNPNTVTVRNVNTKEAKDLYSTVDVKMIKQIEYSPVV